MRHICAKCKRPIDKYQGSVYHRYEHYHLICAEAMGLPVSQSMGTP